MTDESEYTVQPPSERRRLVVQLWAATAVNAAESWQEWDVAAKEDVEQWARVHAPEWLEPHDTEASTDQRIMGGQLVFAGTRIPVDTLWPYFRDGASTAVIAEEYPELGAAQIDEARSTYESAVEVHRWGGDIPDTEEPGDSEALQHLRECIECHLAGFTPEDGAGHCRMVIAASWEVQRQVDAARDAEDERDRAVERAKVAEADRAALLKVAHLAWWKTYMPREVREEFEALPEHIRREL